MTPTSPTGVILAAGQGRRMGRIGLDRAKPCLPVGNRPLLHHHLDLFAQMQLETAVIVVGFRAEAVVAVANAHPAVRSGSIQLRFVEQEHRGGIAHALRLTREVVHEHLVVVLGDTYLVPGDLRAPLELLTGQGGPPFAAVLSVRREEDPEAIRRECSVRFDGAGRLLEIREKPERPFNDLKPCGLYFFDRRIFAAIDRTVPSPLRGEVEITDAIQELVSMGELVGQASAVAWDVNLNTPADLLLANLAELRRRGEERLLGHDAQVHEDAVLERVVIGDRARVLAPARLIDCLVLDDAVLAEPVRLQNCILVGDQVVRP